jgi:hypothetical protein
MFSLEQILAPPPLSALASLLLLCGLDCLGLLAMQRTGLLQLGREASLRWQAAIVGAMLLALLLYPLVLLGLASRMLMRLAAGGLLLAGALHVSACLMRRPPRTRDRWQILAQWIRASPIARALVLAMLLGTLLLALGPVTNADALDYHMGAAIALLNNGGMPANPEWFHSRFAGNGEVLNALGLAVGAEQFGSLLQFASLMAVASLLLPTLRASESRKSGEILLLAVLSSPVLLFLISGPKPQLWPIAMTTLGFALLVNHSVETLDRRALRVRYLLVCLLCMSATQAKFNFLLGGGMIGCLAIFTMARQRELPAAFLLGVLAAALVMLPPLAWKMHTYGASPLDALLNPMPGHLPGTDRMIAHARNNPDFPNSLPFPLSILLPSQPGGLTTVLGLGSLLLLWVRPGPSVRGHAALAVVLTSILATAVAAPPAARMYMEPYFWGLYLCSLQAAGNRLAFPAPMRWITLAQAAGFCVACWFGAISLFPGALAASWRERIMDRSANGHALMHWVDRVLPQEAVLLNSHRSMALAPRLALDYGWTNYVDPASPEAALYLDQLKAKKVTHVLLPDRAAQDLPLSGCFGPIFAGPGPGRMASRNPFNQSTSYDAWLMKFDSSKLPGCARQPASPQERK